MADGVQRLLLQLKALADPVRLRIMALCAHGECSVSELTKVMVQSQPRISQHVKQLCDAGLLERFRDGHFVFYRVSRRGQNAQARRRLLALIPGNEPEFGHDLDKLRELRGGADAVPAAGVEETDTRRLHRALIELTVAAPVGDLLDIGSGQGQILKLLASRAHRAIGVDIDPDARQLARAELLLAGVENASLRKGSMYELPFEDGEFDTIILDDVLGDADEPLLAICEAKRILKGGGRLLLLAATNDNDVLESRFAGWCQAAGLRLAPPRRIPSMDPRWLLAVATPVDSRTEAA